MHGKRYAGLPSLRHHTIKIRGMLNGRMKVFIGCLLTMIEMDDAP